MLPRILSILTALAHLILAGTVDNLPGSAQYVRVKLVENPRIRYTHPSEYQYRPQDGGEVQKRFIHDDDEEKSRKMASQVPAAGTTEASFYDYFLEKDDSDDDDSKDDDDEEDDDDDDDDDDSDDYDDDDEENKKKVLKKPLAIRGVHRKHVKAHKIVFPLLMAYKLKFFTMLPLLVGSLVLLVGTTGIAGFFFALFSAALGLHVKPHYH